MIRRVTFIMPVPHPMGGPPRSTMSVGAGALDGVDALAVIDTAYGPLLIAQAGGAQIAYPLHVVAAIDPAPKMRPRADASRVDMKGAFHAD